MKHGSTFGGDSWNAESQQRNHRLHELIGSKVRKNEVRQLSNGKWACLVCPWKPILDNLVILNTHRTSKKHQSQIETFRKRQRDWEDTKKLKDEQLQQQKKQKSEVDGSNPLLIQTRNNTEKLMQSNSSPPSLDEQLSSDGSFFQMRLPPEDNTSKHKRSYEQSNSHPLPSPNFEVLNASSSTSQVPSSKNTISVGNRLWKAEYTKEDKEWVKYVDKILRLGWKMDAEGKVHRDTSGEVEYDSDEDPPTPPVGEMPEFLLRKYAPASQ